MMKNIMIRCLSAVAMFFATVFLACCETPVPPGPEPIDDDPKVLLMYDNIDDNVNKPFTSNVAAAGRAVASGALIKGQRVIVFHRQPQGNMIYELVKDGSKNGGFRKELLKLYDRGEMSSLSAETIASVVGDMRALTRANHYGFVFGSHGTGWLPTIYSSLPSLRSAGVGQVTGSGDSFAPLWSDKEDEGMTRFLAGYGQKLEVAEFADALDGWEWDFVLLDDCFMASVEALYEMKNVAEYVIASPTEIMIWGFPYDKVVRALFSDWDNLGGVGEAFVEAYRKGEIAPGYPYATVAVVKSSELDALASVMRRLRMDASWNSELNPALAPEVQGYEGLEKHVFFDMDDYVSRATQNLPLLSEFREQLARTVVFADHTNAFYSDFPLNGGGAHGITSYCGLSVFIPWEGTEPLMPAYRNTAWYKAVYE